jgi:hypothetical protein
LEEGVTAVSLYPNPSTGIVTFKGLHERGDVTVTDIIGRIVAANGVYNETEDQLRITVEKKGMVIIRVKTSSKTVIRKVYIY